MRSTQPARLPTWATVVTWIAVLGPLPYTISRVFMAAGIAPDLDPEALREYEAPGWGSFYILGLAALTELVAFLTYHFLLRRRDALPSWVPLLGGRAFKRRTVLIWAALVSALLLSLGVPGALRMLTDFEALRAEVDPEGWGEDWGIYATFTVFLVWSLSLTTATLAYLLTTRERPDLDSNQGPTP